MEISPAAQRGPGKPALGEVPGALLVAKGSENSYVDRGLPKNCEILISSVPYYLYYGLGRLCVQNSNNGKEVPLCLSPLRLKHWGISLAFLGRGNFRARCQGIMCLSHRGLLWSGRASQRVLGE